MAALYQKHTAMKAVQILFTSLAMCASYGMSAQFYADVVDFSGREGSGNARYEATAGAMVPFGANASSINVNPAALAVFSRNTMEAGIGLEFNSTRSDFMGSSSKGLKILPTINNLSLTGKYIAPPNSAKLKWYSLGLNIDRQHSFNRKTSINGTNKTSSMTDDFLLNPRFTDFAYKGGAIEGDSIGYFTQHRAFYPKPMITSAYNSQQANTIEVSGSNISTELTGGANINDRLYLGIGISVNVLSKSITDSYSELKTNNPNDVYMTDPVFFDHPITDNFKFSRESEDGGIGISSSVGLIYKPLDFLSLSASYRTPTYYSMDLSYSGELNTYFTDKTSLTNSEEYQFSYEYVNPQIFSFGGGVTIGTHGFIAVNYETQNLGDAYFMSDEYSQTTTNDLIYKHLKSRNTLSIGGELSLGEVKLRAGVSKVSSPYVSTETWGNGENQTKMSGGIGYQLNNMYWDLTYVNTKSTGEYALYADYDGNLVTSKYTTNRGQLLFTLGTKF